MEAAHSQLGAVHRGPREAVVYRGPQGAGPVHRGPQGAGPVRRGLRGVGHSRNLGVEAGSRRVGEVELRMGHTAGSLGEGRGNKKCVRHNYVAAVLTASATEREDVCVCLCVQHSVLGDVTRHTRQGKNTLHHFSRGKYKIKIGS